MLILNRVLLLYMHLESISLRICNDQLWDNSSAKGAETFMDKIDELAGFIKRKVEGAGETLIVQNDPSKSQRT